MKLFAVNVLVAITMLFNALGFNGQPKPGDIRSAAIDPSTNVPGVLPYIQGPSDSSPSSAVTLPPTNPTPIPPAATPTPGSPAASSTPAPVPSATPSPTAQPEPGALPIASALPVGIDGGTVSGLNGKVAVTFPKGTLSQPVNVWIVLVPADSPDAPPTTMSGSPFRIVAKSQSSGAVVNRFPAEINIAIPYDPQSYPNNAHDLTLYYYDLTLKEWIPLPSQIDEVNHLLIGKSNHLTDFDFDLQSWQAARLPTLDAAQVSPFTGAGTYSYPIQVPEGPGGLKPSLSLSYNSQVVDSATLQTQASWVGMGWSLDTGYIERNINGTNDQDGDDTYSIVVGGISSRLLPTGNGVYHTADESFWQIKYIGGSTNAWTVWDKVGNIYYFENQVKYPIFGPPPPPPTPGWDSNCSYTREETWRWSLTRMRNKFGKELTYTYFKETQGTKNCYGLYPEYENFDAAVYPETIVYPNNRYRIRFEREARTDYNTSWTSANSRALYQKSRLKNIYAENDSNGDGTFETLIRKIHFTYADAAHSIFPGYTWSGGSPDLTLASIQEYGADGSSYLPVTSFTYDGMHLTQVDNGYGGKVIFTYTRTVADPTKGPLSQRWIDIPNSGLSYTANSCYNHQDTSDVSPWTIASPGSANCDGFALHVNSFIIFYNMPLKMIRPGQSYYILAKFTNLDASRLVDSGPGRREC